MSPTEKRKRDRISKTISLLPKHEAILLQVAQLRPDIAKNHSLLFQELLEISVDPDTGRAKSYLAKRDEAIQFEEDCAAILSEAGYAFRKNAKLPVVGGHRVDFLVEGKNGSCIVELKSSGRRNRLELALGSAIILAHQSSLPLVVCVPYLLDTELVGAFSALKICLCEPKGLLDCVRRAVGTAV